MKKLGIIMWGALLAGTIIFCCFPEISLKTSPVSALKPSTLYSFGVLIVIAAANACIRLGKAPPVR